MTDHAPSDISAPAANEPPQAADAPAPVQAPLKGIGGWLVLVALGQVLGPIRLFAGSIVYYVDTGTVAAFQKLPVTMYGELVLNIGKLVFAIVTSVLFFKEKKLFRIFFTVEAFGGVIVLVLDAFWISLTTNLSMGHLLSGRGMLGSIGMTILGIIWVAYIWRSRRAENTFVN